MRTWEEVRQESLQADAEEAAAYIRVALEGNDVQMLIYALRNVREARGSFDDLNLSRTELLAIVHMLSSQSMQLPHAA